MNGPEPSTVQTDTANTYVDPTTRNVMNLISRQVSGPVTMLNLLRLRETADYTANPELAPPTAISGREAYDRYVRHTLPYPDRDGRRASLPGHQRQLPDRAGRPGLRPGDAGAPEFGRRLPLVRVQRGLPGRYRAPHGGCPGRTYPAARRMPAIKGGGFELRRAAFIFQAAVRQAEPND